MESLTTEDGRAKSNRNDSSSTSNQAEDGPAPDRSGKGGDEREEEEASSSSPARSSKGPSSGDEVSWSSSSLLTYSLLPHAPPLYRSKHVEYIVQLGSALDDSKSLEGALTTHLRMSGVYWTLTALSLLQTPQQVDTSMQVSTHLLNWVFSCYDTVSGGFGGNTGHEPHVLYTLSALQILALADAFNDPRLHVDQTVQYLAALQHPHHGWFAGDLSQSIQEIDTRFTYCAVASLSLLGRLDAIDVDAAANFVLQCRNSVDGGFGSTRGAESHAGQVFCCVAALSILHRVQDMDVDLLCWWLSERQVDSGGLNGRPEKQADVCYSWWILSSLSILGRMSWISAPKLATFILQCQDTDDGGIADRPDDMPDVFHTFFGLAGLSLLGYLHGTSVGDGAVGGAEPAEAAAAPLPPLPPPPCRSIDPVYALPTDVVQRLNLPAQVLVSSGDAGDPRLAHYTVVREQHSP